MTDSLLTLSNDIMEVTLSPSVGGAISSFTWISGGARKAILRESHTPLENVLDAACFPLVPFCNRIRGGSFSFRGRQVRLAPNMAGDRSPLHGQGWLREWRVDSKTETEAGLVFDHEAGEWPWAYAARQGFALDEGGLNVRLSCRNESAEAMPCGLGFHPYFQCGPATRIETDVAEVWTVDEDVLPVARMPAEGRYAISDDPVCGRDLDNGYGGWSGRTLLTDPGWPYEIELSSTGARYFQLYSPKQGGIFVAEPVTHANAALNEPEGDWLSLGLRILEPGEEMILDARIAVEPRTSVG